MWIIRCMVKHKNVCVLRHAASVWGGQTKCGASSSCGSVAQSCLFVTPWSAAQQASLSLTISWTSLKLMSTESVMPSNHLVFSCPLTLLPPIFSSIRVFSTKSALHIRWPKYCSFSFSISPSSEYSGLVSFRIDWFDLLAVHGTLKSLQHHSSKASILQHFSFFMSSSHICTWLLERP